MIELLADGRDGRPLLCPAVEGRSTFVDPQLVAHLEVFYSEPSRFIFATPLLREWEDALAWCIDDAGLHIRERQGLFTFHLDQYSLALVRVKLKEEGLVRRLVSSFTADHQESLAAPTKAAIWGAAYERCYNVSQVDGRY